VNAEALDHTELRLQRRPSALGVKLWRALWMVDNAIERRGVSPVMAMDVGGALMKLFDVH
jgi:hypothetical protein